MATTVKKITTPYDASLENAKSALFTPAQLRVIANQQAGAQINTQLGAVNATSTAEQKQYADLANRAAGLAKALGSFGPGYGSSVFDAYNKAAETVGQLGTGLVGQVAEDWQGEQAASQATIDRALGGLGKVSSYDPAELRSALQYGGVTMPGSGLANSAVTAGSMAEFGAAADQAKVGSLAQDYISKAAAQLDQRAAERAAIVAKRPELFQTALQAQREDNARTQTHIDSLVSASTTWLQNQRKLKQTDEQLAIDKRLKEIAATHIDPRTGEPVGGWTWADKAHTVVIPWTSKIAAKQADKRLDQGNRQLDITEQHYNDMFSQAKRANDLRAQAKNAPGKFDKDMSAAVGYISDGLGHPLVLRDDKPVPYKTPGKPGKPLDAKTMFAIRGSMTTYADALKNGAKDPKTGQSIQEPVEIADAIGLFMARGYLGGKPAFNEWGMQALAAAYGAENLRTALAGYDPETKVRYGYQPGDYDVPTPPGVGKPTENDPRFVQGKPWDPKLDPIDHLLGASGIFVTKSGKMVVDGKYM